jgi:hypothetical protein
MHLNPLADLFLNDFFVIRLENIRTALQEQHSEDKVFIGGGIHAFTAKDIRSAIEVTFELCQRQLRHRSPRGLSLHFYSASSRSFALLF